MKSILAAAVLLVLGSQAHAGTAQAEIDCVSSSGKTKLSSFFPGDSMEAGVLFTIEGKTLAYENADNKDFRDMNGNVFGKEFDGAAITDIEANDRLPKGLTLKVSKSSATVLRLESIKGTSKITHTHNGQHGSFSAKLQGVDPRHGGPSKVITVACKYRYEI
jgi:hypothetical protein